MSVSTLKLKFEYRPLRKQYFDFFIDFYALTFREKDISNFGTSLCNETIGA